MKKSLRVQMFMMVALLGACAGDELVSATDGQTAPATGSMEAPAATGGMLATGGTPVAGTDLTGGSGGVEVASGGSTAASGGSTAASGGSTTASGGSTTTTGGTEFSTGGNMPASGGATEPPPAEIDFDALFPPSTPPSERVADPNNPAECPAMAPENPVGDCLGLPIYVNCKYGTYNCVCDWYHWLCAG